MAAVIKSLHHRRSEKWHCKIAICAPFPGSELHQIMVISLGFSLIHSQEYRGVASVILRSEGFPSLIGAALYEHDHEHASTLTTQGMRSWRWPIGLR
jgi:hypothetical protein